MSIVFSTLYRYIASCSIKIAAQLTQRHSLDLADTLARDPERNLLERSVAPMGQPIPQLKNLTLALG